MLTIRYKLQDSARFHIRLVLKRSQLSQEGNMKIEAIATISCTFVALSCNLQPIAAQWTPVSMKSRCPNPPDTRYDALNRRQSGVLVPVANQGRCGNCWAFAGTHTFADLININTNRSEANFSPDHLTKCTNSLGNGCCGGFPSRSYNQFINAGAYSSNCFPYTLGDYFSGLQPNQNKVQYKNARPLTCPATCARGSASPRRLQGFRRIDSRNRGAVIAALNSGPVYASFYVPTSFLTYACGVYTEPIVLPFRLPGHAVEIVDYSSSAYTGSPFYVIKNSWGPNFGENGYFRIVQNSRVFKPYFYAYTQSSDGSSLGTDTTEAPDLSLDCGIAEMSEEDGMISTASTFAIGELNNRKLITCANGNTAMIRITSTMSASQQIVAGAIITVTAEVGVTGCEEQTATVQLVVLEGMNNTLTLLDYSYSSAAMQLVFNSCLLMVFLMLTVDII